MKTWTGPARWLFVPMEVRSTSGWLPAPTDFRALVERRVFQDIDHRFGVDHSLNAYMQAASGGKAWIDATVSDPVIITDLDPTMNPTLVALSSQPQAHTFMYAAVVYPSNNLGAGAGMAQAGPTPFTPPRAGNQSDGGKAEEEKD